MVLDSSPGEAHTHSLEESAANNVGKSNNIKSKLKSKSNIQYVKPKSNNNPNQNQIFNMSTQSQII